MPRSNSGITLNEITQLAKECNRANLNGDDVIELLREKGYSDPVEKWYDIRRWMKSNAPSFYANIPMKFRLEIRPESYRKVEEMSEHSITPIPHYVPPTEKVQIENKDGTISTVKLYGEQEKKDPLEGFEPVVAPKKRGRKTGTKVQKIKNDSAERVSIMKEEGRRLKINQVSSGNFIFVNKAEKLTVLKGGETITIGKDLITELVESIQEAARLFEE